MRTTTLGLALLAPLAACAPENDIHDIPVELVDMDDLGWAQDPVDLPPPPEPARFHLVEVEIPRGVSENGTVLLYDPLLTDIYTWTEEMGLEWRTTAVIRENFPSDISADGNTIVGSYGNFYDGEDSQAAIWTEANGWQKLGALPLAGDCPGQTHGWSITDDGEVIGLGFADVCKAYAIRWDATNGMTSYEQVGNGGNRASAVSDHGEMAVGFAQGNYSRTPAVWYEDGTGQVINMAFTGEFYGVNSDGTKAVGQFGSKAAVWTPGVGHTFLGTLTPGPNPSTSTAFEICGLQDDLIIGKDTADGGVATAWTEETGLVKMDEYLVSLGLELPPNTRLYTASYCSKDKRYIVGTGAVDDRTGTWIAVLPEHVFETDEEETP